MVQFFSRTWGAVLSHPLCLKHDLASCQGTPMPWPHSHVDPRTDTVRCICDNLSSHISASVHAAVHEPCLALRLIPKSSSQSRPPPTINKQKHCVCPPAHDLSLMCLLHIRCHLPLGQCHSTTQCTHGICVVETSPMT